MFREQGSIVFRYSNRKWRPFIKKKASELYKILDDGCWQWLGLIHKHRGVPIYKGYFSGKIAVWISIYGTDVPGTPLKMTCGNSWCVNPEHIVWRRAKQDF